MRLLMPPVYLTKAALDHAAVRHVMGTAGEWTPPFPSAIFKFVDLVHADAVASGSILLGNPMLYSRLDNGRADDMDGTVIVRPNPFSIKSGEGADIRRGMAQFGHYSYGDVTFAGNGIQYSLADPSKSMLCFSDCLDAPSLTSPTQAVFRIDNVEAYTRRLMSKLDLDIIGLGNVQYAGTVLTTFASVPDRSEFPFQKNRTRLLDGYSYEGEREFRFVIEPSDRIPVGVALGPDSVLAHLTMRIV